MRRRGRPPKLAQEKRDDRLDLRVSAAEKQAFKFAAESENLDLSVWIRVHLHRAASDGLAQLGPDNADTDGVEDVESNQTNADSTSTV